MDLRLLKLTDFTQRGLNLLGRVFGNGDARVILSTRAESPLTVMLETRTVMLDPGRTGPFDLALGVRLLRHRSLRAKKDTDDLSVQEERLTALARTELAAECRGRLARDFPGITQLRGRYRTGNEFDGLRVSARSATLRPLPPMVPVSPDGNPDRTPLARDGEPIQVGSLEYTAIPDIDLTGTDDDFAWLIDALERSALPLHTLPSLEDLPFVRIPFRVCTGETYPAMEWLEEQLADPEAKKTIDSLMNCIRRKSEVRQERRPVGARTASGVYLDPSRLVDAVLTARAGLRPKPFRKKGSLIEPVFDPREHLTVLALDLSDIWQSSGEADRFISHVITAFQQLEVDLIILAYAGQLVRLSNGRDVFLHFTTMLKGIDEAVDEAFWNRTMRLVRSRLHLPGEVAHFHPLGLQDIIRQIDRMDRERSHSYHTIVWWARRWMSDIARYDAPEFLMRVADNVDYQMRELGRRLDGTLDTLAVFMAQRLKNHGRPGEFLSTVLY